MNDLDQLRRLAEKTGVPGIDLDEVVVQTADLELIPREVCETHRILPVLVRGEQLFLAMVNPKDTRVIDEIEFVTGKKVYAYLALGPDLARAIDAAYDARGRRAVYFLGASVSEARQRDLGVDGRGMALATPAGGTRRTIEASRTPSGVIPSVVPSGIPAVGGPAGRARTPAAAPAAPVPAVPAAGPPAAPAAGEPEAEEDDDLTDLDQVTTETSTVGPLPTGPETRGSAGRYSAVATSKLILVVDDEEDIRTMLKRVLLAKGHRVIEAETGPLALQSVKRHVPDLLILDAMLPGLHGFDVARRLKASERYGAIPIIMISAVYRGWRVVEDLKTSYGIFDYLEKPFRLAAVVDAATRALSAGAGDDAGAAPDLDILSADAARALDEGIAAYRAGDIDRAIAIILGGTKLDPLAYRLHFHLALLYGKKDLVFDGIAELEVAIELNPKHFPSLKNLAILYERAGFKNRAVEIWERCVHAAPDAVAKAQVKERLLVLL